MKLSTNKYKSKYKYRSTCYKNKAKYIANCSKNLKSTTYFTFMLLETGNVTKKAFFFLDFGCLKYYLTFQTPICTLIFIGFIIDKPKSTHLTLISQGQ